MTSFVKPNIDKTLYLWSENALKVIIDESTGGVVDSITLTNGGSGYTSMPTVNFSGSGGATATATGVVNNITLNNAGAYLTIPPTSVSLSGGGGTGATATIATTETETTTTTKYPKLPFTSYTNVVYNGTVVRILASSSSYTANVEYWRLFDNDPLTKWLTEGTYDATTGYSTETTKYFNNDTTFYGEWAMIDLGESIILEYYKLAMSNEAFQIDGRTPQIFRIYATNDGASWNNTKSGNWVQIHAVNDPTIALTGYTTFSVGNQTPYRYYAIIVNKIRGGTGVMNLQMTEWELYNTPTTTYTVNSITLTNGGSGYTTAPQVVFNGGTASTPASASTTLRLSTLAITNGGSGYTTAPTVSFSGGGGTGATATTTATQFIQGVERCFQYDWDIPEISLNQNGKLSLEGIVYKTFTPVSTGTITKIKNIGTPKYNYSSKNDDGVILDVSHWNYLKKKKTKCPPVPLTPQTINKISLSVDESNDEKGVELTTDFVAVLKITEDNVPKAEWGSSKAVNVRQMTIPTYN